MESFVIKGGQPLSGTIRPAGNKNAALPIIAASLLADGPVVLRNVPRIRDVDTMLELVASTGAEVTWSAPGELRIDPAGVRSVRLDPALCTRIRASVLLAAPLVARTGHCLLPPPGGDVIGRRRLDTHLLAFRSLGARARFGRVLELEAERLVGGRMFLDEASVTATENAITAAVLAEGETIIGNAACEPHVQDLCRFLVGLGASIEGIGSNLLRINGVERLRGGEHTIGPDYIEVASFVGLAAVTGGELAVDGVIADDLRPVEVGFSRLGVRWELDGGRLRVPHDQELTVQDDLGAAIPKIDDGPWPAFPADLTAIAIAVATQASGTVLVFEKMFENRLFFVDKLVGMGARIILCDPHRAVVNGPTRLYGERLESPDIRAGMAMLLAALAADGESVIGNVGQIDRGYERIDERLRGLGASIERARG
ncbi:MAG TPA: UDP-N-acetylglucosamine 1-carboxyvinyltransferase [Actinomycetes bacterium]|jgi:UDP-N-acetylglucosamine 1-carboxyvinyltransferase|nr:UDP-N-acetylglucosamine 1-carboxyvinyltransferase [Actinomycetes bacterium]